MENYLKKCQQPPATVSYFSIYMQYLLVVSSKNKLLLAVNRLLAHNHIILMNDGNLSKSDKSLQDHRICAILHEPWLDIHFMLAEHLTDV